MKKMLNRDDLLKRDALEIEEVELSEEEVVCVRQMTGRERDKFEQSLIKEVKDNKGKVVSHVPSTEDYRAKLAVCTVCNEDGSLIFQFGDYSHLSQNISASKLEKIASVAQRLNRLSVEEKEDTLKNSDAGETGNSTSDSVES